MSVSGELSTRLSAASTRLTLGDTLYTGQLPETTKEAMALFETGGLAGQRVFGRDLPPIERPRVQVIARSTPPDEGGVASDTGVRTLIDIAWRDFHGIGNTTIGGTRYLHVNPTASPSLLEVDEAGRQIWSFNSDVLRATPATGP